MRTTFNGLTITSIENDTEAADVLLLVTSLPTGYQCIHAQNLSNVPSERFQVLVDTILHYTPKEKVIDVSDMSFIDVDGTFITTEGLNQLTTEELYSVINQ